MDLLTSTHTPAHPTLILRATARRGSLALPILNTRAPIVCVVDDDPRVLRALERRLRFLGVRPRAFPAARQLLDDPRRRDAACFLLDVRMPAMSGYELAARLAAEETVAPVIFISAHPEETAERARAAGGCDLLRKPFEDDDLVGALRQAIGEGFAGEDQPETPHPTRPAPRT